MNNPPAIDLNIFNVIFVIPILNILLVFYNFFSYVNFPGPLGFSIIFLTLLISFLLLPITRKQRIMSQKLNELKPALDKISKKYKNDKTKIQQEHLKLYQKAGVNPAVGCIIPLIQFPFFIALFNVLDIFLRDYKGFSVVENVNKVVYFSFLKIENIDTVFFGFNLSLSPQKSGLFYYLFVPLVTAFLQYIQVNLITPRNKMLVNKTKEENQKDKNQEDIQKIMNVQLKFLMPMFIGWFSYTLPVGLSLYWNVFSVFNIIQYIDIKKILITNFFNKNKNDD